MSVSGIASYFQSAHKAYGLSAQAAPQTATNTFNLLKSDGLTTASQDQVKLSPAAKALLASYNSNAATNSAASNNINGTEQSFLNYAKMTPAQRIRDQILKSMGLTEQQLDVLPPAQRQAAEQKIAQEVKERLAGQNGTNGGSGTSVTNAASTTAVTAADSVSG